MSVFDAYGKYYNLLYQDKDYPGEVKYIADLIAEYSPDTTSCLNIGCGTGNHDFLLAEAGFSMVGIDLSDQMIEVANQRLEETRAANIEFRQGDVRTLSLNKEFDVVLALFHVISYQNSDQEVNDAFKAIHDHLKPGGVFIFDTWFGPAVLGQVPENRIKEIQNEEIHVLRKATPVMDEERQVVEVHYGLTITEKSSGKKHQVTEQHNMRYFFEEEMRDLLQKNGLELIHSEETMTKKPIDPDTWSSLFIARRI